MNQPYISAIVAMAENRVIGRDNQLPWHLPADLKHFKAITTGHPILMGGNTYRSIGKPLPNRTNIIITRDKNLKAQDGIIVSSLPEAIEKAMHHDKNEIFIIGGAQIYQQALPYLTRIYLTVVHCQCEGNIFFPELVKEEWREIENISHPPDQENIFPYSFLILERIK